MCLPTSYLPFSLCSLPLPFYLMLVIAQYVYCENIWTLSLLFWWRNIVLYFLMISFQFESRFTKHLWGRLPSALAVWSFLWWPLPGGVSSFHASPPGMGSHGHCGGFSRALWVIPALRAVADLLLSSFIIFALYSYLKEMCQLLTGSHIRYWYLAC